MNKDICISVIIPCWNGELYIRDTIYSIIHSWKKKPECYIDLIIVNDGSVDKTEEYIHSIITPSENVTILYLYQNNSGPSVARNNGLKHAKGDYITFLDADDLWAENYLESVLNSVKKSQPDIIEFNSVRFVTEGEGKKVIDKLEFVNSDYFGCIEERILSDVFLKSMWYVWARVYKKNVLSDAMFNSNIIHHEDAEFLPRIYLKAATIARLNKELVYYRLNLNSITSKPSVKSLEDHFLVCNSYLEEINKNKNFSRYYKIAMINCLWGYKRILLDLRESMPSKHSPFYYYLDMAKKNSNLCQEKLSAKKKFFIYLPNLYFAINIVIYKFREWMR